MRLRPPPAAPLHIGVAKVCVANFKVQALKFAAVEPFDQVLKFRVQALTREERLFSLFWVAFEVSVVSRA